MDERVLTSVLHNHMPIDMGTHKANDRREVHLRYRMKQLSNISLSVSQAAAGIEPGTHPKLDCMRPPLVTDQCNFSCNFGALLKYSGLVLASIAK